MFRNLTAANIDLEPTGATTFVITNTLVTDGRIGIFWTWGDNAILSTPSCLVSQAPGLK